MDFFFSTDSPLIRFLGRLADLITLNLLFILTSLPIFTIGASLTALHYVSLKLVRKEEGYIARSYFKSFKENFLQSTIIWIFFLILFAILGVNLYFYLFVKKVVGGVPFILTLIITFLVLLMFQMVFPMQSHFENTILNTLKNSAIIAIGSLPKVILMIFLSVLPVVLLYNFGFRIFPLIALFGVSAPVYLSASLYHPIMMKFDGYTEDTNPDDISDPETEDSDPQENVLKDKESAPEDK
ncbi:MAG: DUF624 domain-containing protein [Lachnospiraceae bacterium]|nr:DUF624 domain-containing protein [Lachnospiraceae bacterium]